MCEVTEIFCKILQLATDEGLDGYLIKSNLYNYLDELFITLEGKNENLKLHELLLGQLLRGRNINTLFNTKD